MMSSDVVTAVAVFLAGCTLVSLYENCSRFPEYSNFFKCERKICLKFYLSSEDVTSSANKREV